MCMLRDSATFCAGYNSDVTRCWPVSGSFSPQQRDIYEAVLEIGRSVPVHTNVATYTSGACSFGNTITCGLLVCRDCIKHIRPGIRVSELHSWSCSQVSHMHCDDSSWKRRHVCWCVKGNVHCVFCCEVFSPEFTAAVLRCRMSCAAWGCWPGQGGQRMHTAGSTHTLWVSCHSGFAASMCCGGLMLWWIDHGRVLESGNAQGMTLTLHSLCSALAGS